MSEKVLGGLLRRELGFDGVIVSDAMDMKAIADHFGFADGIMRGARAGIDLFMCCHSHAQQHEAIELLVKAVEQGHLPRARLEASNRRLDRLSSDFVRPASTAGARPGIGSAAHQGVVDRVKQRASAGAFAVGHDPTAPEALLRK